MNQNVKWLANNMGKKNKNNVFCCQNCGYQSPKWLGKCPDCGKWHTLVEEIYPSKAAGGFSGKNVLGRSVPIPIDEVETKNEERLRTGIKEFDRVLGGGIVSGTLVLIGGDPGIGKSTLMLQVLSRLAEKEKKVLYVSGEESIRQIRLRSQRLGRAVSTLFVLSEIDVEVIRSHAASMQPDLVVIDSIQTMFNADLTSAPGSVSQVRESTVNLMLMAKKTGIPFFLVGHVTKDGAIAGPRLLEHMVDTVLYFEGDRNHVYRILRAVKNRFGSTNEIGVFEMKATGLMEVGNPSAVFLAERPKSAPGSVVTASMEGSRPILVELQALCGSTSLGTARRTILGLDPNRVALLVAVMEKKLGMQMMGHDVFMNVVGGVKIMEPAVDLGIVSAIASSFLDRPIPDGTVVLGEVGLTGEVRAIAQVEIRVAEIKKMGFTRCLVPEGNLKRIAGAEGVVIAGISTVTEAVEILF
jgi:DNA repair protein RadA/Sms